MPPTHPPLPATPRALKSADVRSLLTRYLHPLRPVVVHDAHLDQFETPFTHRSVRDRASYERLECLGDSVLSAIITSYTFLRYPDESEAFISRLRANLISGRVFAQVSQQVGLPSWIRFAADTPPHVRTKPGVHCDVYESFVGAIFTTQGFDLAYEWAVGTFEEYVDVSSIVRGVINPRERLSNACVAALGAKPIVETTRHSDGVYAARVLHPVTKAPVGESCAENASHALAAACDSAMRALVPTFPGSNPPAGV